MNKFLTYAGQQPIWLGDIDYMQSAVADALKNLLVSYTGQDNATAILSGLVLSKSGNDVSWTAGIVALAGEILPVAAGELAGVGDAPLYLQLSSVLSGSRTMGDGTVRQCWDTRSAIVTTQATSYALASIARVGSLDAKAGLYGFSGTPLRGYDFAVLANVGGAWFFAFRIFNPQGIVTTATLFSNFAIGLPQAAWDVFKNNVPSLGYTVAPYYIDATPSGGGRTQGLAAVDVTAESNRRLRVTVKATEAPTFEGNCILSLQTWIPLF